MFLLFLEIMVSLDLALLRLTVAGHTDGGYYHYD